MFIDIFSLFSPNKQKRYESKHKVAAVVSQFLGFRIYNRNLSWVHDTDFARVWKAFPDSGRHLHDRKFTLFSLASSVAHLEGEVAECGVFRGGGLFVMGSACPDKALFGFDSFSGLSEPQIQDSPTSERAKPWVKGDMTEARKRAETNLLPLGDRVHLYEGWIPDRFDEVDSLKFAIVHIDVDLYQPTFDSLKFFSSRMVSGGVIVCDDYGFETCPGARLAMDEFFGARGKKVIHLPTGQGIMFCD